MADFCSDFFLVHVLCFITLLALLVQNVDSTRAVIVIYYICRIFYCLLPKVDVQGHFLIEMILKIKNLFLPTWKLTAKVKLQLLDFLKKHSCLHTADSKCDVGIIDF